MTRSSWQIAALACFLGAACSVAYPVPTGVVFPTIPAGDAQPTAMLEGVLRREGACLVIDAGDQSALALWSSDFHAVELADGRIGISDSAGNVRATEGEPVSMGGGEYGAEHLDFLEGLAGDIPLECQRQWYDIVASIPAED